MHRGERVGVVLWAPAERQPPPPIAHAPKPTVVMSSPLEPSGRVGNVIRTNPVTLRLRRSCSLYRITSSAPAASGQRGLPDREHPTEPPCSWPSFTFNT